MTKDVLVRVKGTQFMDDENDVIEMITAGTFNEKLLLELREYSPSCSPVR